VSEAEGTTYLDRLAARSAGTGTVLCLGLDPVPTALPKGFSPDISGIERFVELVLEARPPVRRGGEAQPVVLRGLRLGRAGGPRAHPGANPRRRPRGRGRQARRHRHDLGAPIGRVLSTRSASTRSQSTRTVGQEALLTYLERPEKFAYVLCRTSNAGATDFQALRIATHQRDDGSLAAPSEPLWARIAREAAAWGPGGTVGLVVGATAPDELRAVRTIAPHVPFLVPAWAPRAGSIEPVLVHGPVAAKRRAPARWRAHRERLARHCVGGARGRRRGLR
jgi:orotidine-5'-phosphate decarboxylase